MYRLNRNYVAQSLCENKARPQLHCNGKCYLARQVQKDTKDATQPSGSKKDGGSEVYFYPVEVPGIAMGFTNAKRSYPPCVFHFLPSYHHSLLRPPQGFFV